MAAGNRGSNGHNGRRHEVPPSWLGGWFDPELEQLFRDEPELSQTARLLRAARPEAAGEQHFRARLRTSLLAEAERRQSRRRRWFFGPAHVAWAGVGVGVVAIAATVLTLFNGPQADHQTLVALSNVSAQHSVSPDDVITVSFNQPMDQAAVVAGLHIQPATNVLTAWRGNDLLITPVHHLTGNTPYTVTIEKSHARTAAGATAPAAIHITFGTAPNPTGTSVAKPATLVPVTLGQVAPGAAVLFAPDGSIVVTDAPAPAAPAAPASASPGTLSSPSPSTAASQPAGSVVEYPGSGAEPVTLGQAATAAAFSPNGNLLALAIPTADGGSDLSVSGASGASGAVLAHNTSAINSLAWSTNQTIVYATQGDVIRSVELTGVSRTLAEPVGAAGIQVSPNGKTAYLAPASGTGGQLLQIASGATQTLTGSGQSVAFSADGSTVAWVDNSQHSERLQTEPVNSGATITVAATAGASISAPVLSASGTELAYVQQPARGPAQTVIAELPSGTPIAVGPGADQIAFSPDGRALALIGSAGGSSTVERASLPGGTQPMQASGIPAAARTALQAFVDAQVRGDLTTLASLSAAGADIAPSTPAGLTRGYVVSGAANPDGTISATAELIIDPTSSHPEASRSDEALTLARAPGASTYLVTSIVSDGLHDEVPGPQVVSITSAAQHGSVVVQINFDSDLDRATVPGAITILSADGSVLTGPVSYDPDTRSVTITLRGSPAAPLDVSVSQSLRDVDGQALSAAFSARASF